MATLVKILLLESLTSNFLIFYTSSTEKIPLILNKVANKDQSSTSGISQARNHLQAEELRPPSCWFLAWFMLHP
jgi:hypothetical protein